MKLLVTIGYLGEENLPGIENSPVIFEEFYW